MKKRGEIMDKLIQETLELMMQISAEEIAQGNDSLNWIGAWAEMAEAYGEI